MSIKLGNTEINKVYLGGTEIKKAYLGGTLVYENQVHLELPFTNQSVVRFAIQTTDSSDWTIDWGDGVIETFISSAVKREHTYSTATTGTVKISFNSFDNINYFLTELGAIDVTNISNLTSLTFLSLKGSGSGLYGDISGFSNLTSLQYSTIEGNNITGSITNLSTLTNVKQFDIVSNGISGDVTFLTTFNDLDRLFLRGTSLTGDLGGLGANTKLDYFRLDSGTIDYTYQTVLYNAYYILLRLASGELSSSADIDQFFIDLDAVATVKSGTIDLRSAGAGSPTATSLSARNSLISKGRTILTN